MIRAPIGLGDRVTRINGVLSISRVPWQHFCMKGLSDKSSVRLSLLHFDRSTGRTLQRARLGVGCTRVYDQLRMEESIEKIDDTGRLLPLVKRIDVRSVGLCYNAGLVPQD